MKLVSFAENREPQGTRTGIAAILSDNQRMVDLSQSTVLAGLDMLGLINSGADGLAAARTLLAQAEKGDAQTLSLDRVRLLAPLTPVHLRCFSVYEKHLTQAIDAVMTDRLGAWAVALNKRIKYIKPPKKFYRSPFYYKGNRLSLSGPDDEIRWPSYSDWVDYELELGVVIGKPGRDISEADALDHIFGYTIFNDFSARDMLMRELAGQGSAGPAKGKDFDTSNSVGPCIVTRDEFLDPQNIAMRVRVNGDVWGESNTADMYHSIRTMVAYASRDETIHAGELFGTGAASNGSGIEFSKHLKPGDVVELEIEGIGTLRNVIGEKAAA